MMMWPGNPIFEVHYSNVNVCEPIDANLGFEWSTYTNDADGRLLFYLKSRTFSNTANDGKGFSPSLVTNSTLPAGEIMLI